jgi:hypothetical protein
MTDCNANATTSVTGPLFCIVLRDGDQWLVEVEWRDGTIEHVKSFGCYSDAAEWLSTGSIAWLDTRLASQARLA